MKSWEESHEYLAERAKFALGAVRRQLRQRVRTSAEMDAIDGDPLLQAPATTTAASKAWPETRGL